MIPEEDFSDDDVKKKEIGREQEYFDEALVRREIQRDGLGKAPGAAVNKGSASNLKEFADDRLGKLQPPDSAVSFGRFETDDDENWYIGYDAIWDAKSDLLVINWQSNTAAPYWEATPEDPLGVSVRRSFETDGNKIIDFEDTVYRVLAADVARLLAEPSIEDALLSELERKRTGEMQDIVRTIQAAQSKVMRSDLNQLLVVQGGPGTGKTAIALHRVSWLLYNYRDRLSPRDVLVVGPNRTFIRYIRNVLPILGDDDVQQSDTPALLATPVRLGIGEEADLTHIKGELRMEGLLSRGLKNRISIPDEPLEIRIRSGVVRYERDELEERLDKFRSYPYNQGRAALRDYMRNIAIDRLGPESIRGEILDNFIDRIWPQLTAASFLQELLGSESRLLRAAADEFSATDVQRLYRRAAERLAEQEWSRGDVPLLDYADFLIRGETPSTFGHVVVDEAQDMSPMELRMIARRSPSGSLTVLGDLAQSTGPWARDSWDEVVQILDGKVPVAVRELEFGYRVPRQIFEVAEKLLPAAAPDITPPRVVRDGPSDPEFVRVSEDDRAAVTVDAARRFAGDGNLVGIIVPETCREEIRTELNRRGIIWVDARAGELGSTITLLSASDSKGLEFDAVVVVEPVHIVEEDPSGLRLLYVALTRTTRHLSVVHSGAALPELRGQQESADVRRRPQPVSSSSGVSVSPIVQGVAKGLVGHIRQTVQPQMWAEVIRLINEEFDHGDQPE